MLLTSAARPQRVWGTGNLPPTQQNKCQVSHIEIPAVHIGRTPQLTLLRYSLIM